MYKVHRRSISIGSVGSVGIFFGLSFFNGCFTFQRDEFRVNKSMNLFFPPNRSAGNHRESTTVSRFASVLTRSLSFRAGLTGLDPLNWLYISVGSIEGGIFYRQTAPIGTPRKRLCVQGIDPINRGTCTNHTKGYPWITAGAG